MKIEASNISMASSHTYSKVEEYRQESLSLLSSRAATIELSDESKSLAEQLSSVKDKIAKEDKEAETRAAEDAKENTKKSLQNMLKEAKEAKKTAKTEAPAVTEEDGEIEMLKRLVELLKKIRSGKYISADALQLSLAAPSEKKGSACSTNDIFGSIKMPDLSGITNALANITPERVDLGNGGHVVNATQWTKITVNSAFYKETETTAYTAAGTVRTSDGREISIDFTVEMSRSFESRYESYMESSYTLVDPLVINLDDVPAGLTEKRFLFDLDADGVEEEISELKQGSGFLALDKNGDGKINDGSELFGTRSGDGFSDLAKYDDDGNGWIDENDEIFKHLKVWTKDEKGNDKLIDLKKADVGAICLGNADTRFSVNSLSDNSTQGVIRKTGLFLKESGGVGSVQHLDIAC